MSTCQGLTEIQWTHTHVVALCSDCNAEMSFPINLPADVQWIGEGEYRRPLIRDGIYTVIKIAAARRFRCVFPEQDHPPVRPTIYMPGCEVIA